MYLFTSIFLPAGHAQNTWPAGPKIALYFLCLSPGLLVCASTHIRSTIITYIATTRLYFSWLGQFRWLLWQRQCRCNNTRLTKSRNARSGQLLMMPAANQLRTAADFMWKTIRKESCNFELAHLKKKKEKRFGCSATFHAIRHVIGYEALKNKQYVDIKDPSLRTFFFKMLRDFALS